MNNELILSRLNNLPEELREEVADFIEYLVFRHKKKQNQRQKYPVFGSCKGLFIISDDFDEPIEDFKEYM